MKHGDGESTITLVLTNTGRTDAEIVYFADGDIHQRAKILSHGQGGDCTPGPVVIPPGHSGVVTVWNRGFSIKTTIKAYFASGESVAVLSTLRADDPHDTAVLAAFGATTKATMDACSKKAISERSSG